jgi:hypothetical protein
MLSKQATDLLTTRRFLDSLSDYGCAPAHIVFQAIGMIPADDAEPRKTCKRILQAFQRNATLRNVATLALLAHYPRMAKPPESYGEFATHGATVRGWIGIDSADSAAIDASAEREASAIARMAEHTGTPVPRTGVQQLAEQTASAPTEFKRMRSNSYRAAQARKEWEKTLEGYKGNGVGGTCRAVKLHNVQQDRDRHTINRAARSIDMLRGFAVSLNNAALAAALQSCRDRLTACL